MTLRTKLSVVQNLPSVQKCNSCKIDLPSKIVFVQFCPLVQFCAPCKLVFVQKYLRSFLYTRATLYSCNLVPVCNLVISCNFVFAQFRPVLKIYISWLRILVLLRLIVRPKSEHADENWLSRVSHEWKSKKDEKVVPQVFYGAKYQLSTNKSRL